MDEFRQTKTDVFVPQIPHCLICLIRQEEKNRKMKVWNIYSRINQLKEDGFKKAKVARKLSIDVKTGI